MEKSKIDWTDSTWNPVTGCNHDCKYCYARNIAKRFGGHQNLDYFLKAEENPKILEQKIHEIDKPMVTYNLEAKTAPYPFYFEPTFHKYRLNDYIGKKGRNIFVCSMADLFGEWVPDEWIEKVLTACKIAPYHNYLFLTKNPDRYDRAKLPKESNFWFGTTVTSAYDWNTNAYILYRKLPHHYTFLSIEPILEDIPVNEIIKYFDWVIIGAETGRRKGKVIPERKWIENIVIECRKYKIPVFMKSSLAEIWGGSLIQEFPEELKKKGDKTK